jgi:hypothetical protein
MSFFDHTGSVMSQNDGLRASEQVLAEQKKQAKRERAAEKRRKKTRDKHCAQGLEHTRKYRHNR